MLICGHCVSAIGKPSALKETPTEVNAGIFQAAASSSGVAHRVIDPNFPSRLPPAQADIRALVVFRDEELPAFIHTTSTLSVSSSAVAVLYDRASLVI